MYAREVERPAGPGEMLADLMQTFNISSAELALRTGWGINRVRALLSDNLSLTREMAVKLEDVFGVSASTWLKLKHNKTALMLIK